VKILLSGDATGLLGLWNGNLKERENERSNEQVGNHFQSPFSPRFFCQLNKKEKGVICVS
jgi:hypothetical protein